MSWLRPAKRSASVSFPFGVSNTYFFSTLTHGNSRRSALSLSRSRVNSFSFFRCYLRAASHSSCDTTFRGSIFFLLLFDCHASINQGAENDRLHYIVVRQNPKSTMKPLIYLKSRKLRSLLPCRARADGVHPIRRWSISH